MGRINRLYRKMVTYYQGEPQQIQHFVKVHSFANMIAQEEKMEEHARYILEAAALVHDIGIKPAMEKYGKADGNLQEQEGPAVAEKMLKELGFDQEVIKRVSFLVGHHHTYSDIDDLDYQILIEADFLVNYYENDMDADTIKASVKKIFQTETGKKIAQDMFFPEAFQMSETWAADGLQDLEDFIEQQGIYIRQ